jgi:hypothetical protein
MRKIVGVQGVLITVTPLLTARRECDLGRTPRVSTAESGGIRPDHETDIHIMRFGFVDPPSAD